MSYLYPTHGHPKGTIGRPWFRINADCIHPAQGHPEGTIYPRIIHETYFQPIRPLFGVFRG